MEGLPGSIAALNAAVQSSEAATPHACGFRRYSSKEMASLCQDGVAQLLSYLPPSYVRTLPGRFSPSLNYHTVAAVSPRMRLYIESLVQRSSTDSDFEGVQVSDNALVYWIMLRGRAPNVRRLELSLWWSERCGLPIVLNAPNACSRVLSLLSAAWRQQVRHLHVMMRATAISDSRETTVMDEESEEEEKKSGEKEEIERRSERVRWDADGRTSLRAPRRSTDTLPMRLSCSTFLKALPTFARLAKLTIAGEFAADRASAAAAASDALRVVPAMPLQELELRHCDTLDSLSLLAGAQCLERLTVHGCRLTHLGGLACCPALSFVDVSENALLADLSALAGAPRLRELVARNCAVVNTDKLHECPSLKYLDLSENAALEDLCGLSTSPRLQEVVLSRTAVSELDVLCSCPDLVKVDVRGCRRVRHLSSLLHLDVLVDDPSL